MKICKYNPKTDHQLTDIQCFEIIKLLYFLKEYPPFSHWDHDVLTEMIGFAKDAHKESLQTAFCLFEPKMYLKIMENFCYIIVDEKRNFKNRQQINVYAESARYLYDYRPLCAFEMMNKIKGLRNSECSCTFEPFLNETKEQEIVAKIQESKRAMNAKCIRLIVTLLGDAHQDPEVPAIKEGFMGSMILKTAVVLEKFVQPVERTALLRKMVLTNLVNIVF